MNLVVLSTQILLQTYLPVTTTKYINHITNKPYPESIDYEHKLFSPQHEYLTLKLTNLKSKDVLKMQLMNLLKLQQAAETHFNKYVFIIHVWDCQRYNMFYTEK